MDFSGIFPALTTPFADDGSVSLADLKHNIQRYNATDLAGFVVNGSTGESVLLKPAEVDGVLVTVKQAAAKGKKLIAGTGAESTVETIERTNRAAEIGYDAALVKTPYYYKPSYKPEVLVAHYRRVADESPIPIFLYSVPQFTGVALESPEVILLAQHSNIVGIKESSGNVQRVAEIIARHAARVSSSGRRRSDRLPFPGPRRARRDSRSGGCPPGKMRRPVRIGPQGASRKSPRTPIRSRPRFETHPLGNRHRRPETRHGPARLPRRPSPPALAPPAPGAKETP